MRFGETPLGGAYVIELDPFVDERGTFARTFCAREFAAIGFTGRIVQVNHSISARRGTVRGMHFQVPPAAETKIIRCVNGAVFDVMVDLRASSPTFLKWYGFEMSAENMRMAYIPEGFAHGFQALADNAALIYHHTEFYSPEHERGLRFDDPRLAIRWPLPVTLVSGKDMSYSMLGEDFTGIAQ
ncbi:MAG: dTDP-4-dehydrorhamnose 3,5-epimerase [Syntrophorhabdus sp.]|nr:dTDP-4-dehydrorhamnose 3,5-epimerase [Syntrophorhabdus sp.]